MKQKAQNNWYKKLVADVKRMAFGIVRTKHAIGKRILQDEDKLGKPAYGSKRIENLAQDLDTSSSDLYKCVQFARKYPEIVTALQNLSWRYIVNHLLPESTTPVSADDKIPKVGKARTRPGDLWILGRHRLLCGDATKIEDVKWLFYGQQADICLTSPPYNLKNKKRYLHDTDSKTYAAYLKLLIKSTALSLIPCQYVFVNLGLFATNKNSIIEYQYEGGDLLVKTLMWDKITPVPSMTENVCDSQFELVFCFSKTGKSTIGNVPFRGLSDIIRISSRQDKQFSKILRATFPVEFASYFVEKFARPKRIVYDAFAGTGTTLIACEKLARRCYAMEIEPHYCDIIIKRWEKYTEQRAFLCQRDGHGSLWFLDEKGATWQRAAPLVELNKVGKCDRMM